MKLKTTDIISDLQINSLQDLPKLKIQMSFTGIKVNYSELARKLEVDRRTVKKYIDGFEKSKSKPKKSKIDPFKDIIRSLLGSETDCQFYYKSTLYRFLKENHGLDVSESTFRRFITKNEEFNNYFLKRKSKSAGGPALLRYETDKGDQAQIDWKESMTLKLKDGTSITLNIFVYVLSYSRFKVYLVSESRSQSILLHFLDKCFEITGGVPNEILSDNMKTIMDEARTEYRNGKINQKFEEFSDDYGFKLHPCIAGRPQTKAKVESPMRILDELYAYNGLLSYTELVNKVTQINNRENGRYHHSYNCVPIMELKNEKDFLSPLPNEKIRSHYKIRTSVAKVNQSSMITYLRNQYSVPPQYIGKVVEVQVYDECLHIYHNDHLIALHYISSRRLNYLPEHYEELARTTIHSKDLDIEQISRENLAMIGDRYK